MATHPQNTLVGRLFQHAREDPQRDALVRDGVVISYAAFAKLVYEQSVDMASRGITADDVVGITCSDDVQHLVACLAVAHLGATSCTISSHEDPQAQAALGVRCGVTQRMDSQNTLTIESAPPTTEPLLNIQNHRSAGFLFSTSGTTGDPKIVVHLDEDIVAQAHRHIDSHRERFGCLASMEHNFAKRHRLYAVAAGATNLFLKPNLDQLVSQCLAADLNVLHVSAFQAQELLAVPNVEQLSHIRLKLGGGHVPRALRKNLVRTITPHLQAGYGTTESGAIAFTQPANTTRNESVGRPLPGIEVKVVDENRRPLPTGERGELAIRGAGMFRRYLNNDTLSAERLNAGWFYTGDLGYLDETQHIFLAGRADDMFVFNSMNIYPQDLESVILQHPSIADVAVVPKPSAVHGSIPVALLVFKPGVKHRLPEIQKYVQKQIGLRSPRQYVILPEIPKTAAGKVGRSQAMGISRKSDDVRRAVLSLLSDKARQLLTPAQISAFEKGDQDIPLKVLNMDSLARMNFLVSVELEFDTVITPQAFHRFRYLGNVVAQIVAPQSVDATTIPHLQNDAVKDSDLADAPRPYAIRFFQRVFQGCATVAQLNTAFGTLECRLTPVEMQQLFVYHANALLIGEGVAEKFRAAVDRWIYASIQHLMEHGNQPLQQYTRQRLAPNVRLFVGQGEAAEKSLIICFTPRRLQTMGIAHSALLQNIPSRRFDVMVVAGPFDTGYAWGRSQFSQQLSAFVQWRELIERTQQYGAIRTMGFSAGARTAIAVGQLLKAQMILSVSGRFHRKKHPLKNIDQMITIRRRYHASHSGPILLSYTPDNARDPFYARVMSRLVQGYRVEITHQQLKLKHLLLEQLLAQGLLADYLNATLLADADAWRAGEHDRLLAIEFPEGVLHSTSESTGDRAPVSQKGF